MVDLNKFKKVFIHRDCKHSELTCRLKSLFPTEKIEWVTQKPFSQSQGPLSAREFDRSKRHIYVENFKGEFFKPCPGSRPGLTCCNYFVLNLGLQCDMNCSYCYLQSFINTPVLTIYANIDQAIDELRELMKTCKEQAFRIGTGEVIDSLSLDPITQYSKKLIPFFRDIPKWKLEFKTKSHFVDQFLNEPHGGNVITSWSMNPQNIIEREEFGTASLQERLEAARKCADKKFLIAFHIDPIIWHPGWQESYKTLVDNITSLFSPKELYALSVGALRFQPEQKDIMRERFGMKSWVTLAETFKSRDGKLRYDHNLRKEMFYYIIKSFKSHSEDWNIFLCMESPETWLSSYGSLPKDTGRLKELFDHSVLRAHQKARTGSLKKPGGEKRPS